MCVCTQTRVFRKPILKDGDLADSQTLASNTVSFLKLPLVTLIV